MRPIFYLLLNTLSLIATLFVNATIGRNIGNISQKYSTLVTPAGYAFSIWGIIYLLLIAFVAYQWYCLLKQKRDEEIVQTGSLLILSNVFNALWCIVWVQEWIGISVLMILGLLFSLMYLTVRLRLEIWDAPLFTITFVWWPICIYLGWVTLATAVNIATFLTSLGWTGEPLNAIP